MKTRPSIARKRSAADRARHERIRQESQHCPSQEELQASGAYDGPIKSGTYFKVRILIDELKKIRQNAGLTLTVLSKRTGMDQASLSRLENGHQPNPTVDTLWRYAHAIGRELVLTHDESKIDEHAGNGKAARSARG